MQKSIEGNKRHVQSLHTATDAQKNIGGVDVMNMSGGEGMNDRLTEEDIEKLRTANKEDGWLGYAAAEMVIDELLYYKQLAEERGKALEWANRIIGSGLDMGTSLRYDPREWNMKYHTEWKDKP